MNINLNINKNIFNSVYYPYLLNYQNRYEVYYGSGGSGKSHFVFQKVVIKALRSKRKVLIVRKTAKSNENSTYQMAIDTLSNFKILPYCKINKSTYRITFPNDSVFLFAGLDDVEKLKSIAGITDIVIEEATEITLDDFSQLDLRLRANVDNLQIYLMFNPVSKANWVYKKWFSDKAVYPVDNTLIVRTTYKDNRFLPVEYVNAIEEMKISNPVYYKIYGLGEFASLDKLVFNNWTIQDFNHAEIKGDLLVGLDFGFVNDTTALVASILDEENKKIYVFQTYGRTGLTNDEIAAAIKTLGLGKSTIIADSAEKKSIEEIKRTGISRIKPSVKGQGSILQGIQKLQQYEIIVHSDCTELINELNNYSWKKDKSTNEYINTPIDAFNHYIDALRYSLQCVEKNKLKTVSKSAIGF